MIPPILTNSEEPFDPAAAVMRQKLNAASGSAGSAYKKHGHHAKKHAARESKERPSAQFAGSDGKSSGPHTPTLREIYDTIVQARDRPLSDKGPSHTGRKSDAETGEKSTPSLSLGALYMEYSGPLLRQFVDGWLKNVTMPGGFGNAVGKRNAGAVEVRITLEHQGGVQPIALTRTRDFRFEAKGDKKKKSLGIYFFVLYICVRVQPRVCIRGLRVLAHSNQ